jgi:hypothetical protein
MRANVPFGVASATEIARRECRHPDRIVGRSKFPDVAKVLWPPPNTAAQLATIATQAGDRTSERTAERWLTGEVEPPYVIIEAVMHKTFSRD